MFPSKKATVPVGYASPVVTVAVNTTFCPTVAGFAEEVRLMLDPAGWAPTKVKVCPERGMVMDPIVDQA